MDRGLLLDRIVHAAAAVLALAGLVVLVVLAALQGDPWKIVSLSIYGACLFFMYAATALYQGVRGRARPVLRKLDHFAIYLLIAGTYTPFTLITLRGPVGWTLFGAVWALAVAGIALDALPHTGRRVWPVVIYLVMGWLVLAALGPLLESLPAAGFVWLLAGGVSYTAGVVFYLLGRTSPRLHTVWHGFVLAGSVCHYIAVVRYVI